MSYMTKPCTHCPYRSDVTPYLSLERGMELAYLPQNRYNTFPCHLTTETTADGTHRMETQDSKECAGFLTVRAQAGEDVPEGFVPSYDMCYLDDLDMIQAYEQAYEEL